MIIMAKKAGKLKDAEEFSKIELEEGESAVVEGIEEVKILLDRIQISINYPILIHFPQVV